MRITLKGLFGFGVITASVALSGRGAPGAVDLEFRAAASSVPLGSPVGIGLYAVSDTPGVDQSVAAMDVVITWDTSALGLTGLDGTGGAPLLSSGFPMAGSGGLNEANPPQDGDGFYQAFANFGSPIQATPSGTLITTLVFDTLALSSSAVIDIELSGGMPVRETVVFGGDQPNQDVTGTLTGTKVAVVPAPGPVGLACAGAVVAASRRRRPRQGLRG